jgi:hypothetical protein
MMSTRTEFRFDAKSRKLKWHERLPFVEASGVIAFSELTGVSVQSLDDSDGVSYRVVLHIRTGDIPLTRHYSTVEPHEETARRIGVWMRAHDVGIATG